MSEIRREWVTLREAAEDVGLPLTTVRDWTRSGAIEMREIPTGRVVDLAEVRLKAMGPAALKRPSDLQDRVADEAPERTAGRQSRNEELASTLLGLQELARQRHP
jgi:hypothetical protein